MKMGCCPECDVDIVIRSDTFIGDEVTCRSCYAYLVVVGLSPIELDWKYIDDQVRLGGENGYIVRDSRYSDF
ncbi:MAG: hypothetical protein ACXACH_04875 [Candidatus Hermodarchaeia archaeon]|jgi:hypothetical protein